MFKTMWLLLLLHIIVLNASSQELSNLGLAMKNFGDHSKDTLHIQLKQANNDTNKVKLLIRVCCYFWRQERTADDSMLYYAQKALDLSRNLNYSAGYKEACFISCKILAKKGKVQAAKTFIPLVPKDQQARLLLVLGEHYLFLPGEQRQNLDSAYPFFQQALSLSEAIQDQNWKEESLLALGKYFFSTGELKQGKESFLQVIRYYRQTGARAREAHFWNELGIYMPDTDSTFEDNLNSDKNAVAIYHALGNKDGEAEVLLDMAVINRAHSRYDTAKKQILQGISLKRSINDKRLYRYYIELTFLCQLKGDLDDALAYAFEGIRNVERIGDSIAMPGFNYMLGEIYADLGQPENSLHYFLLAKDRITDQLTYSAYRKASEQLILLQRPADALALLIDFERSSPPVRIVDKETLEGAKADCYYAQEKYQLAERHYLEMIRLDEMSQQHRKKEILNTYSLSGPAAYYKIARFYTTQKNYAVAASYLDKCLQKNSFQNTSSYSTNLLKDIRWLQFKVDSAKGNYVAAIRNYSLYTAIKDSIFSIDKIKQLQSLEVAFETSKKENNIQMLQKEGQLQQKKLDQSNQFRNFTIASIVMLLLLLALGYNRYRLKQKSNHQLQEKQEEITVQNEQLQHLVSEKEWLLKEVHHRVKNNLQTVVSLLELQSEYLNNEALSAIHDSQNRIYAMSLIHQKLYQSEVGASINMHSYLPELTAHLCDIYNTDRTINFHLDISPIELDVSQAIPIGLIVNEAVTNSCKYAFTDPAGSLDIVITLQEQPMDQIALTISDNGSGLPPDFNTTSHAGLGFKLMMGLVEDLDGQLIIESTNGTRIKVYFNASIPFQET